MKRMPNSPAKGSRGHVKQVCMLCGRPSKETICEPCRTKIQGESLHRKIHEEKHGKG